MNADAWFAERLDESAGDSGFIEAHNAVQWLARLSHSYACEATPPRLLWDAVRSAVRTPEIAEHVDVELRLPTLFLQFREGGAPSPHALDLEGKSSTEIEAWALIELLHRGVDRDRFTKTLPYGLKSMREGDVVKYSPESCAAALAGLANKLCEGGRILGEARGAALAAASGRPLVVDPAPDGQLLLWPDSFAIGFEMRPNNGAGATGAITVGFSPNGRGAGFFLRHADARPGSTAETDTWISLAVAARENWPATRLADAVSAAAGAAAEACCERTASLRSAGTCATV